MKKNQKGFSAIEVLIVLVIVGVLGTIGWLFFNKHKTKPTSAQSQTTNSTTTPSTTQSTADTSTTPSTGTTPTDTAQDKVLVATVTPDISSGYFVMKEWGLKFKVPSGITDIRYAIKSNDKVYGDIAGIFAKPTGSNVTYKSDFNAFEDGHFIYAHGLLYRSTSSTLDGFGEPVDGKKIGNYYYYTEWSFSGLATGNACVATFAGPITESCDADVKVFQLINQGDTSLLKSIQQAQ